MSEALATKTSFILKFMIISKHIQHVFIPDCSQPIGTSNITVITSYALAESVYGTAVGTEANFKYK